MFKVEYLPLETRDGSWNVYIGESFGDFGFTAIKKVHAEGRPDRWEATSDPETQTFDNAQKQAAEFLAHIIHIQDPEVRDMVFLASADHDELIRVDLR